MKIDPRITLDEFRHEMQYRVVRYPLNSVAVRSAVTFARKHQNPEFYRVAANKVHAQRQFQRELNGPSRWERIMDFFSLGSLREVVVTLVLVVIGAIGIDAGRRGLDPSSASDLDAVSIDQLARKLGLILEESTGEVVQASSPLPPVGRFVPRFHAAPVSPTTLGAFTQASIDSSKGSDGNSARLSDEDLTRIVTAVVAALRDPSAADKPIPTTAAPTETSAKASADPVEVQAMGSSISLTLVTASKSAPEPTSEPSKAPQASTDEPTQSDRLPWKPPVPADSASSEAMERAPLPPAVGLADSN